MMTLILGGSGSGKSAYAEDYLLRAAGDKKKYYIATMQIRDAEMQAKVDRHHRLRQGKGVHYHRTTYGVGAGGLANGTGRSGIVGMYVKSHR